MPTVVQISAYSPIPEIRFCSETNLLNWFPSEGHPETSCAFLYSRCMLTDPEIVELSSEWADSQNNFSGN